MGFRSLVLLSIAATALSFAPSARADVPNDGGGTTSSSSSTSSTSSSGAGGSSSTSTSSSGAGSYADCSIPLVQVAGKTCYECGGSNPACSTLGNTYAFTCDESATVQIWCNGPINDVPQDQNVASCTVTTPGSNWGGVAACAVATAAALAMRRRRRS